MLYLCSTVKCKLIIVYHNLPNNLRDAKIKIKIKRLKGVSLHYFLLDSFADIESKYTFLLVIVMAFIATRGKVIVNSRIFMI